MGRDTLIVNVVHSIHERPTWVHALAYGWRSNHPARPAKRIVAFDGEVYQGEVVSRTGGFIDSVVRDGRRCFDLGDMRETERTYFKPSPFDGTRGAQLPFRRAA